MNIEDICRLVSKNPVPDRQAVKGILKDINDATERISENPEDFEAFIRRACLRMSLASEKLEPSHIEEAIVDLGKVIGSKPGLLLEFDAVRCRGMANQKLHRLENAKEDYNHAISLSSQIGADASQTGPMYFGRAEVHLMRGQFKEAFEDYKKAVELELPHSAKYKAHLGAGISKAALGHAEAAKKWLDKAISICPEHALGYYRRGLVSFDLNELDMSEQLMDKAVEKEPEFENALYFGGFIKLLKRKPAEAEKYLEKAVNLCIQEAHAYSFCGTAKYILGKLDESLEYFDKAIEMKPDFAAFYHSKGMALSLLGQVDDAIDMFEQANSIDPLSRATTIDFQTVVSELKSLRSTDKRKYDRLIQYIRNSAYDIIKDSIDLFPG